MTNYLAQSVPLSEAIVNEINPPRGATHLLRESLGIAFAAASLQNLRNY